MRTDVKVGIALGAIVLIVAGAYYGANKEPDIQLAGADEHVREQNKRTLKDLLAPPRDIPTTSQDKTRSIAASPTPDPEPRPQERVVDSDTSRSPDEPTTDAVRWNPDMTRQESREPEDLSNAPRQTKIANIGPVPPSTEAAGRIPRPIGGSAGRRSAPETTNSPRPPVQSPPSSTARRTSDDTSRTTLREIPRKIPRARTHLVGPEDNFSTLAERYYGSQSYAGLLVQANPNVDPRRMKIGSRIAIPPRNPDHGGAPARSQAREAGTRRYYVQEGDSLYAIAEAKLGTGARWSEIYEMNKAVIGADPSRLKVGDALTLPAH